ncbi:MAG: hypothetical protein EPN93_08170 [Spirochaetes bacterium]|nr:MAG: hypothetical protein EPN93_08170 [Spirochaetota bacterium]
MLFEIREVRQIPGEGLRRWFSDEYFDLIVWHDDRDEISGFQLCYDKQGYERVMTWRRGRGYTHDRIDDGEVPGEPKKTPILALDGAFEPAGTARTFLDASRDIDRGIAGFVYETIRSYG